MENNNSVMDVEVSFFDNLKVVHPITVNLLEILQSTKHREKIEMLRKIEDEDLQKMAKRSLPCITPSGIFSKRNESSLISHSKLIAFDIDRQDNLHIDNFADLKYEIQKISNIAYVGLSARGVGCWGLIPISEPTKHREYFTYIERFFKNFGITIDPTGKDIVRLRILSIDDEAYFNHTAEVLQIQEKQSLPDSQTSPIQNAPFVMEAEPVFKALLSILSKHKVDLTKNYNNWFSLGCYLNNLPNGRALFHEISSYHKSYKQPATDRIFRKCKDYSSSYTIGTLLKICKEEGIEIVRNYMVCYRKTDYELISIKTSKMNEDELFSSRL